ncbi:MAG: hypothetical protein WA366_04490 [Pseudolabrys sp.]
MNPEESLSEFFDNQMKDPNTAWSVGSFGAIAEFMRDPDEPVTFRRNGTARSAVTARGGVLVDAQILSRQNRQLRTRGAIVSHCVCRSNSAE